MEGSEVAVRPKRTHTAGPTLSVWTESRACTLYTGIFSVLARLSAHTHSCVYLCCGKGQRHETGFHSIYI